MSYYDTFPHVGEVFYFAFNITKIYSIKRKIIFVTKTGNNNRGLVKYYYKLGRIF